MIVAPIFGYLGDRLKRKYLMACGVLVWSGVVFSSTLLKQDVSTNYVEYYIPGEAETGGYFIIKMIMIIRNFAFFSSSFII